MVVLTRNPSDHWIGDGQEVEQRPEHRDQPAKAAEEGNALSDAPRTYARDFAHRHRPEHGTLRELPESPRIVYYRRDQTDPKRGRQPSSDRSNKRADEQQKPVWNDWRTRCPRRVNDAKATIDTGGADSPGNGGGLPACHEFLVVLALYFVVPVQLRELRFDLRYALSLCT